MSMTTQLTVRVIAVDGKFVGDDIGGAAITVRDVLTREILAQGVTQGDSGPNGTGGLMCKKIKRGEPLPMDSTTSKFTASLSLSSPKQIEVTAFGPLGARGSANSVSTTTWICPGKDIIAGNGLLLELPGLICQIVQPPTHMTFVKAPDKIEIVANVAMMCGCPISNKPSGSICPGDRQPWLPDDFDVSASIPNVSGSPIQLSWDEKSNVAGRFTTSVSGVIPGNYQMTVVAQQISTGNTGVDLSTFIVQS